MAIVEKHINYALVEETRPAMYTAMKYWGKSHIIFGVILLNAIALKMV